MRFKKFFIFSMMGGYLFGQQSFAMEPVRPMLPRGSDEQKMVNNHGKKCYYNLNYAAIIAFIGLEWVKVQEQARSLEKLLYCTQLWEESISAVNPKNDFAFSKLLRESLLLERPFAQKFSLAPEEREKFQKIQDFISEFVKRERVKIAQPRSKLFKLFFAKKEVQEMQALLGMQACNDTEACSQTAYVARALINTLTQQFGKKIVTELYKKKLKEFNVAFCPKCEDFVGLVDPDKGEHRCEQEAE